MKKKNGFIMAETMFVIAILSASLIMIYYAFSTVIANQKTRLYYNHPTYLYRTYYILEFLKDQGIKNFAAETLNEEILVYQIKCDNSSLFSNGSLEQKQCKVILGENGENPFDVNQLNESGPTGGNNPQIFIMSYDVKNILKCHNSGLNICGANSDSFKLLSNRIFPFIKSLNKDNSGGNHFRIVIEYNKTGSESDGRYYYASLGF